MEAKWTVRFAQARVFGCLVLVFGLCSLAGTAGAADPLERRFHFRLDSTSGAEEQDAAGFGFRAVLENGLSFSGDSDPGRFGQALHFDGSDDRARVEPPLYLNRPCATFTAWIKRDGSQPNFTGLIFARDDFTVAGLHFGSSHELRYTWENRSSTYGWNSGLTVPDGVWTFVALVVEQSRATIYMSEGASLRSASCSNFHGLQEFMSYVYIGQDPQGNRAFHGSMDEVRFFNEALTARQLQDIAFNNTDSAMEKRFHFRLDETSGNAAEDASGLGYGGTLEGGLDFSAHGGGGRFQRALRFDGTDDRIRVRPPLRLHSNTATFTAWIKRDGNQSSSAGILFARDSLTVAGLHFGSSNELRYSWNNASATWGWNSGLTPAADQWVFVALVVEASSATIHMSDGATWQSATRQGDHAEEEFDDSFWIGQDPQGGRLFRGWIDEARFYDRALTLGELITIAFQNPATMNPWRQQQTFEGWGTSLAWWGHAIGGWSDGQKKATLLDLLFDEETGLGMNIVRYNIGGGHNPAVDDLRPGGDVPGWQPQEGIWDWNADANQRWILNEAIKRGVDRVDAFSNSPPYWMTISNSVTGAVGGGNNLKDDYYDDFAAYLAAVAGHFHLNLGITFDGLSPMNEPSAGWWDFGGNQEGCHFDADKQDLLLRETAAALTARGLGDIGLTAPEEYWVDLSSSQFRGYSNEARSAITRIHTHSYGGLSGRDDLRRTGWDFARRVWMSEYGTGVGSHDHNAIAPVLELARRIIGDLRDMQPQAWIYWQAIEREQPWHNWGLLHVEFTNNGNYWMTRQYYGMKQFSCFIRPAWSILHTESGNELAAVRPDKRRAVVVVLNDSGSETRGVTYDFGMIGEIAGCQAYRTSASETFQAVVPLWSPSNVVSATLPPESLTTIVVDFRDTRTQATRWNLYF